MISKSYFSIVRCDIIMRKLIYKVIMHFFQIKNKLVLGNWGSLDSGWLPYGNLQLEKTG